jgi:hypothetical protein
LERLVSPPAHAMRTAHISKRRPRVSRFSMKPSTLVDIPDIQAASDICHAA